jgi:hypothetical protein
MDAAGATAGLARLPTAMGRLDRRPAALRIRTTRPAARATSWQRTRAASGRDVEVAADGPHFGRFQPERLGDGGGACAGDGCVGLPAAEQLGRHKDVDFVDLPRVEQTAQQAPAAFDQDVGQLPST